MIGLNMYLWNLSSAVYKVNQLTVPYNERLIEKIMPHTKKDACFLVFGVAQIYKYKQWRSSSSTGRL